MLKLFCNHEWEVLRADEIPSIWAELQSAGVTNAKSLKTDSCNHVKQYSYIVSCKKCGKIKHYKG